MLNKMNCFPRFDADNFDKKKTNIFESQSVFMGVAYFTAAFWLMLNRKYEHFELNILF